MNAFKDAIATFFSLFIPAPTTSSAIGGLEKALKNLDNAYRHHTDTADAHLYQVEEHAAAAESHEYAAQRAARIRNKLADLIG